ncbi:MAG: OmpA family protein [Nitrospinota bacterium]|nr:OmpA family protein [Nitrospinota bacterium]
MHRGKKTLILIAFLAPMLGLALPAMSQEGIEGGTGLIFIDKAITPAHGGFAFGAFYFQSDLSEADPKTSFTSYGVSASAGLWDKVELTLLLPFGDLKPDGHSTGTGYEFHEESGQMDGMFKVKYNFHSPKGAEGVDTRFRYALLGIMTLPLGDENTHLGSGKSDPGLGLVIDKEYDNITWHFMGVYMNYSGEGQDPALNYGAGFELQLIPHSISLAAEVSGRVWSKQVMHRTDNTKQSVALRAHFGHPGESSVVGSAFLGYSSWGGGAGEGSPNTLGAVGVTLEFGNHHRSDDHGGDYGDEHGRDAGPVAGGDRNIIVAMEVVHFMFDSAVLTDAAVASLKHNAKVFRDNPLAKVILEGHACSIGPNGYNYDLGLRRARSVKKFLVKDLGVNTDKVFVVMSQGEEKPAKSNKTRAGRSYNRRVEFLK